MPLREMLVHDDLRHFMLTETRFTTAPSVDAFGTQLVVLEHRWRARAISFDNVDIVDVETERGLTTPAAVEAR
ncbi:MAG: hypothetical protein VXY70_06020, partial [Actinomycetota bacterium]|nr:hypothetical protein [Actinomycetota bacterium]